MTRTRGPELARAAERSVRVVDRLDRRRTSGAARAATSAGGKGAFVRRLGGDEHRPRPGKPLEDPVGILVGEDRRDDDVVARLREPLEQPVDGIGVCAPSRTSVARTSKRPGSAASKAVRRAVRGTPRPPRGRRRAQPHVRRTSCANSASGRTTVAPGARHGELLRRDRLARVAEHLGVLERRRS